MPRHLGSVKGISPSRPVWDLHFHGAWGIDVMRARADDLQTLSDKLGRSGVTAFCPTTLTAPWSDLLAATQRLGSWIRSGRAPGAKPLGIHLEGPYLSPQAPGAHPRAALREYNLSELRELWEASEETLKIVTIAPELACGHALRDLTRWALPRGIRLSAGHSVATFEQAQTAFDRGFTQVTHAWNAMRFHHRDPGILGAALGRKGIWMELIADGQHLAWPVARWALDLHPRQICLVSDCVPESRKVRISDHACRLPDGTLAGGAAPLSRVLERALHELPKRYRPLLIHAATRAPIAALGL